MSLLLNFIYAVDESAPIEDKYVIYFIGESNPGGEGRNVDATSEEIANNPNVQILNNTSLLFENLQIDGIVSTGKNNIIDHAFLNPDNPWHGWELQLGNRAIEFDEPYLIKCGQGGSTLSEWDDGDTYQTKFETRSNAAQTILINEGINEIPYVFMSIGINDSIAATDTTVFHDELVDWVGRVQAQTNAIKIFITTFDDIAGLGAYNTEIINAANEIDYLIRIDTTGATFQNVFHWDYDGLKQICNSMLNRIVEEIPTEGLVAQWLFSGNDLDTSGKGNDAVANNATLTTDRHGQTDKAYDFAGTNEKINMNNYIDLQSFSEMTISIWVKLNSIEDFKVLLWKGSLSLSNTGYAIQVVSGGKIRFLIDTDSGGFSTIDSTTILNDADWYHIACVYTGSDIILYINASPENSDNRTGVINETSEDLIIGNVSTGEDFYINAKLDDIRIYDRALSQGEITALANE